MAKQPDSENRLVRTIRRTFSRMYTRLRNRATGYVKRFARQTDEVLAEEPIDFSAPSIPYYENLANRIGFTRVVLYMVLLVFVVVTLVSNHNLITYENLYYLAKDIRAATLTAQSEVDYVSYPVSSGKSDYALYRGGLVIAGCEVVTAMSGSGRQTLSVNVEYAEPAVRASEKYFLTFGRGETSFAVYNAFVQVHREDTDFPVFDAAVADNGTFAIVTRSRDYTSEVIIYDDTMEPLANYHLGGYVTGLSIAPDGSSLGVLSVEAVNGAWESRITLIRIGNRITERSAFVPNAFGASCGFVTDERLAVILDDRLMIFKNDATVVGEVLFDGSSPALTAIGHGQVAIITAGSADLSEETLTVYDRNARRDFSITIGETHPIRTAGGAVTMALGENALYIRAGDTLYATTSSGRKFSKIAISRDTLAILPRDESELYICTPAYAHRLDESAMEPLAED